MSVDANRAIILHLFALVVWFAAIFAIDRLLPGASIPVSVLVAVLSIAWISTKAHHFLTLSAPRIDEELLSDDECWPDRVADRYEPTEEELREIEIVLGIPGAAAGSDWTCRSCGEKNTKEFAICWKCGSGFAPDDA